MTPEEMAVRRYVSARPDRLPWGAVLRRLGGKGSLFLYVDDQRRPVPERLDPVLNDTFWLLVGKGRLLPR